MEVIVHFGFELLKICILACIYSTLVLLIILLIKKVWKNNIINRITENKKRLWFTSWSFISVGLLIYMFTYWGSHGLGDGPRIPIGHGLIVDNTNWTEYGYVNEIKTIDTFHIEMTKFKVIENNLMGNLESDFYDYKNAYFIYHFDTKELTEFQSQKDFDVFLFKNNLPTSNQLRTFEQNYHDYWGGWRFWLLP